jgi:hypothetical protein
MSTKFIGPSNFDPSDQEKTLDWGRKAVASNQARLRKQTLLRFAYKAASFLVLGTIGTGIAGTAIYGAERFFVQESSSLLRRTRPAILTLPPRNCFIVTLQGIDHYHCIK